MAIVKFGTLITGARGTIGGTTFSANKAGPYCKSYSAPARTLTERRSVVQGQFAGFGAVWQALSGAQRTAWDAFAALAGQEQTNALGEAYYLSGWQWFAKLNGWRIQTYDPTGAGTPVISPAIIEDAPAGGPATAPTLTAFEAHYTAPQSATLTFTVPVIAAGEYLLIEGRQLFSPVSTYTPPSFVALQALENGDVSPFDITDSLETAFGALRPGAQLALRAYLLPTDGYRSAAAEIVAAIEA